MENIYCVMFRGLPLTDETRDLLVRVAQYMAAKKKDKIKIHEHYCEGKVTTQWQRKGIGSTYGTEFQATIEVEAGSTEVVYIIRNIDFRAEDLEWTDMDEDDVFDPRLLPMSLN